MEHLVCSPMAPTTTEQQLLHAFMQMHRAESEWHKRPLADCTPSELRVLFCIQRGHDTKATDIKVSQISRLLHVTSPAVTQLLKGLEARGLVERHPDATDKRTVNFRLTTRGEAAVQQTRCQFMASIRGLIEHLGEAQSAQLAALLTQTFAYFSERAALANEPYGNEDTGK